MLSLQATSQISQQAYITAYKEIIIVAYNNCYTTVQDMEKELKQEYPTAVKVDRQTAATLIAKFQYTLAYCCF